MQSDKKTYELVAQWLEIYHSETDSFKKAKAKALIVTQMLPIIKKIARTIARRATDPIEDMVQAGSIGLLKAIDSYSKNVNDNFKIYAGYLIIGEMKHFLRDKLNTIRVPGHIQELSYRINNFTKTLTVEELNNLTNDEVANALNVSTKSVDYVMQAERRKFTLSLDEMFSFDGNSLSYEDVLSEDNYDETSEFADAKIVFKDVIKKLPDEYRELVELYYYQDLNQKEIAEEKKLSQMQVSRKLKKAFSMLYKMIVKSRIAEKK